MPSVNPAVSSSSASIASSVRSPSAQLETGAGSPSKAVQALFSKLESLPGVVGVDYGLFENGSQGLRVHVRPQSFAAAQARLATLLDANDQFMGYRVALRESGEVQPETASSAKAVQALFERLRDLPGVSGVDYGLFDNGNRGLRVFVSDAAWTQARSRVQKLLDSSSLFMGHKVALMPGGDVRPEEGPQAPEGPGASEGPSRPKGNPLDQLNSGVHHSVLFPKEWVAFKNNDAAHDAIGRLQHQSLPYGKPRATVDQALEALKKNPDVMGRVFMIGKGLTEGGGRVTDANGKTRDVQPGEVGVILYVEKSRQRLTDLWILSNGLHEFRGVPVEVRMQTPPALEWN